MKLRDFYSEYFAHWLSRGNLINRDKISSLGIKPLFDRFLTKKYVTKVWCVYSIPVNCEFNITQTIRSEMFKMHPSVRTIIHTYNIPIEVNVKSDVYKRQLAQSSTDYNKYRSAYNSLEDSEKLTGKTTKSKDGLKKFHISKEQLIRIKEKYESFTYVYQHTVSGGEFMNTYFFVQAQSPSTKELNKYRKTLNDIFKRLDLYYKELQGNISQYLANFGPASYLGEEVKAMQTMLMSDENLASITPYKTRGLVGGSGALFGVNWHNKLPFLLNLFGSSQGQVALLIAATGKGKTYAAFQICISLVADDVHCSSIDIKGGEWERLKKQVPLLVISMDDKNPRFVNTLRLDDIECDHNTSYEYFRSAITGTIQLFSIAINLKSNEGNDTDLEMILEQAISKLYSSKEVSPDNPLSFYKTSTFKYSDILPILDDLEKTKSFTEEQRKLCSLARIRAGMYFQAEGRYSAAFRDEITISEILDTPLIIYSLNKNREGLLDNLDNLKVFMAQFIDNKKHSIRKDQGLHSACFYEEMQRCDQFGKLLTYMSHKVTGSRSNNVIIFLLLNALSVFDNPETKAIKSNINTIIAGELTEDDIKTLSKDFSCKEIEPYLMKIREDEKFKNCFAAKYDIGIERDKCLYKVVFPENISEDFRTRDVKKENYSC